MRITHVVAGVVPVVGYGGIEREADWVATELARRGHHVTIVAKPGSSNPLCEVRHAQSREEALAAIPADTDFVHFHAWYPDGLRFPHLNAVQTIEKLSTDNGASWSFVSAKHASLYGKKTFVYNGFPVDAYRLAPKKKPNRYIFLAGIARPGKGLSRAVELARKFDFELDIAGGPRWTLLTRSQVRREGLFFKILAPRYHFHGIVDGDLKLDLLGQAQAFLMPIRWEEPFGMAPVEGMLCGTPVLATPLGSMPEIITSEVGRLFQTDEEFRLAREAVSEISPVDCREFAADRFSIGRTATAYLELYQRILDGETLQ